MLRILHTLILVHCLLNGHLVSSTTTTLKFQKYKGKPIQQDDTSFFTSLVSKIRRKRALKRQEDILDILNENPAAANKHKILAIQTENSPIAYAVQGAPGAEGEGKHRDSLLPADKNEDKLEIVESSRIVADAAAGETKNSEALAPEAVAEEPKEEEEEEGEDEEEDLPAEAVKEEEKDDKEEEEEEEKLSAEAVVGEPDYEEYEEDSEGDLSAEAAVEEEVKPVPDKDAKPAPGGVHSGEDYGDPDKDKTTEAPGGDGDSSKNSSSSTTATTGSDSDSSSSPGGDAASSPKSGDSSSTSTTAKGDGAPTTARPPTTKPSSSNPGNKVGIDEHGGAYRSVINNMMNFVKEFKKNTSLERVVVLQGLDSLLRASDPRLEAVITELLFKYYKLVVQKIFGLDKKGAAKKKVAVLSADYSDAGKNGKGKGPAVGSTPPADPKRAGKGKAKAPQKGKDGKKTK